MMVGLRVLRGGLTAALIMIALPVAAVATASLVSSQAVTPLDVFGNLVLPLEWRRVCRGTS